MEEQDKETILLTWIAWPKHPEGISTMARPVRTNAVFKTQKNPSSFSTAGYAGPQIPVLEDQSEKTELVNAGRGEWVKQAKGLRAHSSQHAP